MFSTSKAKYLLVFLSKPFQVFEPLFLVHVSMQRQWRTIHDHQQTVESLDAFDAVGEHHGAPRILEQEVIKVEVLLVLLTVDVCFGQRLHCGLLPGEVDDFGLGLYSHLLHEGFQIGPGLQFLLLLQEAAGQTVSHCQSGGEHKHLSLRIKVCRVQHLQQTLQLSEVAFFHHSVSFINYQTPGRSN